ncbi:MAG: 4-(cytidine 5'-diphospho)-2-C-methyl-D-erythritol kinase, partial [Bacteroidales bacterium]|nr:4-(cytidine 5'-diphospho)-2-C-methyl-D-erythritol kinase [Bacteroidales bacterium]
EKVRECYSVPSLKIHLHKQIPTESGLGGGSSDAVQVLQLLKAHFKLNISKERMWKMALELGSDCPFFIEGQAARVQGKGEVISPISLSLKGKYILMIKPEFSISTSDAFSKIIPHNSQVLNEEYLKDINQWQAHFVNDFEKVIGLQHPEIINIKEILLKNGAVYASLSGSGSAVYGIFNQLPTLRFPSDYFYWAGQLQ